MKALKVFESPDQIEARNLKEIRPGTYYLTHLNPQIPFGYYNNKMRIGKIGDIHSNLNIYYKDIKAF